MKPILSLIVPMYNEENTCESFFNRVEPVLERIGLLYEIICVNDGSDDKTLDHLLEHRQRNPAINIIDLSRHFGKEQALTAALDLCRGDACVPIDADLQDPPELIAEFVARWREGYDVVYGIRVSRAKDTLLKRITSRLFYHFFNSLTEIQIPANAGDFRLLDRKVIEALRQLRERDRFMKGIFAWVGYRQTGVEYTREKRSAGSTKWNYWRLWNFALTGITAFSTIPLRVWTYSGVLVSLIAFTYAGYLVILKAFVGIDVPGYASLMVAVLFLSGIQLLTLGIIGEYLGRIYSETKGRPIYLVKQVYGFDHRDENSI